MYPIWQSALKSEGVGWEGASRAWPTGPIQYSSPAESNLLRALGARAQVQNGCITAAMRNMEHLSQVGTEMRTCTASSEQK